MRKVYYYPTIGQFANDVDSAKTSKLFFNALGNDLSSQKISDDGWSGTRTYEQASKLLLEGDSKSAELIRSTDIIRSPKRTNINRPTPTTGRIGYMVHIPNYLKGLPNCMVCDKQVTHKQKVITIVVAGAVSWTWSAKKFAEVNAKVVTAIRMIEASGIRVNLLTLYSVYQPNEQIGALIKIKDASKYLSIEKMAYCMVNPAFFRRHFFRFLETRQELTQNFPSGYGTIADIKICKEMLKDEGIKFHYLCHITDLEKVSAEEIKAMFEEGNN